MGVTRHHDHDAHQVVCRSLRFFPRGEGHGVFLIPFIGQSNREKLEVKIGQPHMSTPNARHLTSKTIYLFLNRTSRFTCYLLPLLLVFRVKTLRVSKKRANGRFSGTGVERFCRLARELVPRNAGTQNRLEKKKKRHQPNASQTSPLNLTCHPHHTSPGSLPPNTSIYHKTRPRHRSSRREQETSSDVTAGTRVSKRRWDL